jgi:WD40 repeat protein
MNIIAAVGKDNSVSVIDTRKFSVLHKLGGNSFEADALCQPAISPCGGLVAAGSKDGRIFVFDITTGKEAGTRPTIQQLRHPNKEHQDVSIVACAWNPVGLPLATADRMGTVSFWT